MASQKTTKPPKDTKAVHISRDLVKQARIHTAAMGLYGTRATVELALREFFERNEKRASKKVA